MIMINLIVLQPTSLCNLNCSYCYVPNRKDKTKMSFEILETVFKKTLSSKSVAQNIEFLWHAGEPLTVGLDYFKQAVMLQKKHNTLNKKITNTIQTNGTLINENWCKFFKENLFNIGLSIDGPSYLHDEIRVTWSDKPSLKKALKGAKMLQSHGIQPGVVCVLTNKSLDYPSEIFHFFKENNLNWIGFNVEEIEHVNSSSSLNKEKETLERFTNFISLFYELWKQNIKTFNVREFSDIISSIRQKQSNLNFTRNPLETQKGGILTFDKYGNISPYSPEFSGVKSDRYKDFIIGNIKINSIEDVFYSNSYELISESVKKSTQSCKSTCEYYDLCGGGFLSNKFFENGQIESTETTTCKLRVKTITDVILSKLN